MSHNTPMFSILHSREKYRVRMDPEQPFQQQSTSWVEKTRSRFNMNSQSFQVPVPPQNVPVSFQELDFTAQQLHKLQKIKSQYKDKYSPQQQRTTKNNNKSEAVQPSYKDIERRAALTERYLKTFQNSRKVKELNASKDHQAEPIDPMQTSFMATSRPSTTTKKKKMSETHRSAGSTDLSAFLTGFRTTLDYSNPNVRQSRVQQIISTQNRPYLEEFKRSRELDYKGVTISYDWRKPDPPDLIRYKRHPIPKLNFRRKSVAI